jgi:hypothetical protein
MVKAFTKNCTFMIKMLRKQRIKGYFLRSIKNIYIRCTVKLMLDGEGLKAFSLSPGTGQRYHFLLLVNIPLETR